MSSIKVISEDSEATYEFTPGTNLLDFLRAHGYEPDAVCGGRGTCGKCKVRRTMGAASEEILACSTTLVHDCSISLSGSSGSSITWNSPATSPVAPGKCHGYGLAIDLGTTTVAVNLYNLTSGELLGALSEWNCQRSYGADVISRIDYCINHDNGLEELSLLIRRQLSDMAGKLCRDHGLTIGDLTRIALAGNTVMQHILSGLSPESIARAPFNPASLFGDGGNILINNITAELMPCIAGYVGGDITAGLFGSGIGNSGGNVLYIDIGTNGEIVLKTGDTYTACAVACGPAFEGAGISCGKSAATGAVSSVRPEPEGLSMTVIGGGKPDGICGTGLIDLIAVLLDYGYIDESGALDTGDSTGRFCLAGDVYIDQHDIRQLQLAKAAVYAGIIRLCESAGLAVEDIDALYLAGGFGNNLNIQAAARIGLFPGILQNKVHFCGNSALAGTAMVLLDPDKRSNLSDICGRCHYIELSSDPDFTERFVEAMAFPGQIT